MTGALVLPQDIEIIPLADFSPDLRGQMGGTADDYAITRPRSRVPSKVIDSQGADFLRQFQTPTTLVDAILRFSRATKRDPMQVLDDAYPLLESCLIARLLVEPGIDAEEIRPSLGNGAALAGCVVQECIQALVDTELYRARIGVRAVALKIARVGAAGYVNQSIAHEAEVLTQLDGRRAPKVLTQGKTEDARAYLVSEWISGERCGEAASTIRANAHEPLPIGLLTMCVDVLDAYAALHSWGVIHSDVHSNNLLIARNREVQIIDFGLARIARHDGSQFAWVPRAGVPFFFEPECAKALLGGAVPPPTTFIGEQYAVAALIYFLLTGRYYLNFSFDKQVLLRQIVDQPPLPLAARGIAGAMRLDEVLSRALNKDAASRFPDMGEMATAFREAVSSISAARQTRKSAPGRAQIAEKRKELSTWCNSIINSLPEPDLMLPGRESTDARSGFEAAGIAYGIFRMSCVREDVRLFALANRWLDRASGGSLPGNAPSLSALEETSENRNCYLPYQCASGVEAVKAFLAHSAGDLKARATATEQYLQLSGAECQNAIAGKSRTLLVLSLLVEAFGWDRTADCNGLLQAGNRLITELWEDLDMMPALVDSTPAVDLGIANGWAGYLYSTMRWNWSAQTQPPASLKTRLWQLLDRVRPSGSNASWLKSRSVGGTRVSGWRDGSAGFVFLWTLAHRFWPEPQWLSLAEDAGEEAYHAGSVDMSLYCSVVGRAYSQLNLYKHTGDRIWLTNAVAIATLGVRRAKVQERNNRALISRGLYKGDIGLAVLTAELQHPENSAMPFFEGEAWPRVA